MPEDVLGPAGPIHPLGRVRMEKIQEKERS